MQFVDTHCHIHEPDYPLPAGEVIERANAAGVTRLICVGTDAQTSRQAVAFVQNRPNMWASVGLHPHEAKDGKFALRHLKLLVGQDLNSTRGHHGKIVAIGECGLDYFYNHSSKQDQINALHAQIELALEHDLPLIFHIRDAFSDFWPIFDSYPNLRGVLHSFTDTQENLDKALKRGLYVGLNGIMTFTKNSWQLDVAKAIPLQKLLLETDAPFLTPVPFRGTINEPAHVNVVAEFLANIRGETLSQLAKNTTQNAQTLFQV